MQFAENNEIALNAWRQLLGSEHVISDVDGLAHYGRSTLPDAPQPLAVLRPSSTDEVRALVHIAAESRLPLYPISCGKNWGYGDACAVTSGNVIVDLSRMNRILEVNTELGYAIIEPGVTQGQFYSYLREHNVPYWMDCTGAGPEASIVGNAMERGFGHTPYSDHFRQVAGMEIVLADSRVLNTGFGHYANARSTHIYPYGVGPWLDGLFTQSSLGIVTKMGLWLMPEPEHFNAFFFSVGHSRDLGCIIDALRPLRLNGVLQSAIHIGNDLRVLSGEGKFPHNQADIHAALPDELRQRMRQQAGIGAWNVAGALYGSRRQVAEARKRLRRTLRTCPIQSLHFLDDTMMTFAHWALQWVQWSKLGREYSEKLAAARPVYDLLKGIPNSRPLAGAYWRHRAGAPSGTFDPGQDNCGLMWVTAILPMTGFSAQGLMDLVEPIYSKHGVDPLITLTLINTRAVDAVMTIAYDREDEQHKLQANVCYKELFNTLMNAGYIPYRVGIQSMRQLNAGSEVFWDVVNEIKRALDPIGILSPGRYDPLSIEMMESSGILVSAQPPHLPPILSTQEIAPRFGID